MNADSEKVDEAEKITRQEHAKLSNRNFKVTGVLLVVYLVARLLHWVVGFPSSLTEVNYGFVSILGVIYLGYILELLGASFREVRLRSKETNERLTEIEKRIDSQSKQMSKRLSAIEGKFGSRTNGSEETQNSDDEDSENDGDRGPEGDEVLIGKYHESAQRGEAWGQHNLGITYYNGTRVAKDYVMAAFWFRKAAEQGDDEAQLHLADILRSGDGLKPDYEEALKWYGKIVEQESAYINIAEDRLGDMYANGEGVTRDYLEAAKWWARAAEHGWTWGHYRLGELYAKGDDGVLRDDNEAYFRLFIATAGKGMGAMQKNAIEKRNECANRLAPEALLQTQERAQKWIEAHPKSS
jgi:hypothetical protein